jgi:hypothetical protein
MLVIALALVLVAVACAVLLTEASRSVVPLVGSDAHVFTHAATPAEPTVAGPTVPTQRTASESARAAATYGYIADLPAESTPVVRVNP